MGVRTTAQSPSCETETVTVNLPHFLSLRSNALSKTRSVAVGSLGYKIEVSGRLSGKWRSRGLVRRL